MKPKTKKKTPRAAQMEAALKILLTWSTFDDGVMLNARSVAAICRKGLGRDEK